MVIAVSGKDASWDAGHTGDVVKEDHMDLVAAFKNVDSSTGEGDVKNLAKPKLDCSLVRSVGRSDARNASKHVGVAPCVDPGVKVAKVGGGPAAVNDW